MFTGVWCTFTLAKICNNDKTTHILKEKYTNTKYLTVLHTNYETVYIR